MAHTFGAAYVTSFLREVSYWERTSRCSRNILVRTYAKGYLIVTYCIYYIFQATMQCLTPLWGHFKGNSG